MRRVTRNTNFGMEDTRNAGLTDLSNMNMPMSDESPISHRSIARLKDQLRVFNILYMIAFFAMFMLKTFIVITKYPRTTSTEEKIFGVVDLALMIGSIFIFCVLTGEKCFNKCFLVFGIIYNSCCAALLVCLCFKFEDLEIERHVRLTLMTFIAHFAGTVLAIIFLLHILIRVVVINIAAKRLLRLEAIERNNLSHDQDYSLATVDDSQIYSASMPKFHIEDME